MTFGQLCAVIGVGIITATFAVLHYLRDPLDSYIERKEEEVRGKMRDWASKVCGHGYITPELSDEFWDIVSTYAEEIDTPKDLYTSMRDNMLLSGLLFIIASFLSIMPEFEPYAYILVIAALLFLASALYYFIKLDGVIKSSS